MNFQDESDRIARKNGAKYQMNEWKKRLLTILGTPFYGWIIFRNHPDFLEPSGGQFEASLGWYGIRTSSLPDESLKVTLLLRSEETISGILNPTD